MHHFSHARRLGASLLLTLCAACNADGGGSDTDGGPASDASTIDQGGLADGTVVMPELDAQVPDSAIVDAAVDAGPPPNALRPGWCSRTQESDGQVTGVTNRTYDARGRVVEEAYTGSGDDPVRHTTTFEWDDADRLIRKIGQREGVDHQYADETYTYAESGLLREVTWVEDGTMEVLRWTLSSANGRYTGLRFYVNDEPWRTYETLEWDADGKMTAWNTHLTATDEIVGFRHYTYKDRNPGLGKIAQEERDQDFEDGLVDVRRTYRYEPMRGVLESSIIRIVAVDGGFVGDPETESWEHLFLTGFHQVESHSVNGELRSTYRHLGDTVEITSGCSVVVYEGRIEEFQRPGGQTGATPEAGGEPRFRGPSAGFEPTGRPLRATNCEGEAITFEFVQDEVGNVLSTGTRTGTSYSGETYTYECWE